MMSVNYNQIIANKYVSIHQVASNVSVQKDLSWSMKHVNMVSKASFKQMHSFSAPLAHFSEHET